MGIEDAVKQRILNLCAEKNITINALAARAGMPRSSLKNIIYGTSKNTGIVTIHLLCDAFGMTITEFFEDDVFLNIDEDKD